MRFRSSLDKYRKARPAKPGTTESTVVTIESLSNDGDGVARLAGKAIFVPHTAPGDEVEIVVRSKQKRFARGTLKQLIKPSSVRVTPKCEYVGTCGGCTWQHVAYDAQLAAKQQQVQDALERIGGFTDVRIQPIVPSSNPYHYRNRIRGYTEDGRFHYRRAGSQDGVPITACKIAQPAINDYLANPNQPFSQSKESVELATTADGSVTSFPIRADRSTQAGFRQINDDVSNALTSAASGAITKIIEQSQGSGASNTRLELLDLYCGQGSWSFELAMRHPDLTILGVDSGADNIRAANERLKLHPDLNNLSFHRNTAESVLNKPRHQSPLVIVDPPRAGLSDEVTQAFLQSPPRAIVYISCHPATLARDLAKLCHTHFSLSLVQPFDMFPQTPHVETLVVLSAKTINQ